MLRSEKSFSKIRWRIIIKAGVKMEKREKTNESNAHKHSHAAACTWIKPRGQVSTQDRLYLHMNWKVKNIDRFALKSIIAKMHTQNPQNDKYKPSKQLFARIFRKDIWAPFATMIITLFLQLQLQLVCGKMVKGRISNRHLSKQ